MNTILTYLHDNWDRLELDRYSPTRQLSTVMITPRFRASSHVVCLLIPKGTVRAGVSRQNSPSGRLSASVTREVLNLRTVQASRPEGFKTIPKIIAYDEIASRQFLLETALVGRPMDPPDVRHNPDRCSQALLNWLIELQQATQQPAHTQDDWFDCLVTKPMNRFTQLFPVSDEESKWLQKTEELVAPLRESSLPLVFQHGDLSHPNVMWLHSGQPGVVDWESAEPHGLPAFDLFFFLSYIAFAKHKTRSSGSYLTSFQDTFFGSKAWSQTYINSYCQQMNLSPEMLTPLFVLTWLHYMTTLLGRLDEAPQSSGKLGTDTIAWLRENRYYQLWRHAITHVDELRWGEI